MATILPGEMRAALHREGRFQGARFEEAARLAEQLPDLVGQQLDSLVTVVLFIDVYSRALKLDLDQDASISPESRANIGRMLEETYCRFWEMLIQSGQTEAEILFCGTLGVAVDLMGPYFEGKLTFRRLLLRQPSIFLTGAKNYVPRFHPCLDDHLARVLHKAVGLLAGMINEWALKKESVAILKPPSPAGTLRPDALQTTGGPILVTRWDMGLQHGIFEIVTPWGMVEIARLQCHQVDVLRAIGYLRSRGVELIVLKEADSGHTWYYSVPSADGFPDIARLPLPRLIDEPNERMPDPRAVSAWSELTVECASAV